MSVALTAIKCPVCADQLTLHATAHGIVWVCGRCRAFGANLAVIRKVAPREFVKHLWLAAVQLGMTSKLCCPSCSQPLQEFGVDVEISPSCKICTRCFLIWFDAASVSDHRVELHGDDDQVLTLAFRAIHQVADALKTLR
jgi:hypothetical protein